MQTVSLHADSVTELEIQLDETLKTNFSANLAIVFSSVNCDLEEVKALFNQRSIDLLGASSAGEICDELVLENSISVMLFDLPRDYYRCWFQETGDRTTYQVAYDGGEHARTAFANPAVIVVSGGLTVDAEQIVYGLKDGLREEVPIFGGLAGDDLKMQRTFVFDQHTITYNGLGLLVIDTDKVEVKGKAESGWKAVGAVNTITKAEGNILQQINGEPALDVFLRYFGFFDNRKQCSSMENLLDTISGQYPLQILREGAEAVLRSPLLGNEEDRSLLLAGGVREGDRFRFSISPGFEVVDETIQRFKEFNALDPIEAEAVLLFNCKGRHAALGPVIETEIQELYREWNAPMIGFFTYGEIGPTQTGLCEFHNETCCLVTLREK